MKKLLVAPLMCSIAFSVLAQDNTVLEIEQAEKIEMLLIQLDNTQNSQQFDSVQAKASTGLNSQCNIASIPLSPGTPSWSLSLDQVTGKGAATVWRYKCGGTNALVFTVNPANGTKGVFSCPSMLTTIIQNGIQYDVDDKAVTSSCGTFYIPTNIVLYSSKIDIDQAFTLKYDQGGLGATIAQQTLNIPAAGATGGGNITISNTAGLWYDPAMSGLGFNLVHAPNGVVVYYYGYTAGGQRLWLFSDTGPITVTKGESYTLDMFEGTPGNGGSFTTKPSVGSGTGKWGTLTMTINSCSTGQITLNGNDGTKTFSITKLANINGLNCVE